MSRIERCDFCNVSTDDAVVLIAGKRDTHICDRCVMVCLGIVNAKVDEKEAGAKGEKA